MENEKKYSGYGYHGGGRKKKAPADKVQFKTIGVCGSPAQIAAIKAAAAAAGLSVSAFVVRSCLGSNAEIK